MSRSKEKLSWTIHDTSDWSQGRTGLVATSGVGGFFVIARKVKHGDWEFRLRRSGSSRVDTFPNLQDALVGAQWRYASDMDSAQYTGHIARRGVKKPRTESIRDTGIGDGSKIVSMFSPSWKVFNSTQFNLSIGAHWLGRVTRTVEGYSTHVHGTYRVMHWRTIDEAKAAVEWYATRWLRAAADSVEGIAS